MKKASLFEIFWMVVYEITSHKTADNDYGEDI